MKSTVFSRRDFLYSNAFCGLFGTAFFDSSYTDELDSLKIVTGQEAELSVINTAVLLELKRKYHTELFEVFLPNMDKLIIDHEVGGFMCDIDNKEAKLL